jgi:Family of unknown function (DUF6624)
VTARPDLRAELLRRVEHEQAARRAGDMAAATRLDAANLPWLKRVIAEHGWPGRSLVGEDGAHAAWLLVQHATGDQAFQAHCLELLTAAAAQDEASQAAVAYLTDRVLMLAGEPQVYGTQLTGRDGQWVPKRLRDPGRVGELRAAAGLGPLAGYVADFRSDTPPPEPAVTSCPACGGRVECWLPEAGEEATPGCPACGHTLSIRIGTPPPGEGQSRAATA